MNTYVFRCVDANPNLIALCGEYFDFDVLTNDETLVDSPRQY